MNDIILKINVKIIESYSRDKLTRIFLNLNLDIKYEGN